MTTSLLYAAVRPGLKPRFDADLIARAEALAYSPGLTPGLVLVIVRAKALTYPAGA
jgi:hypothetical protein